MEHPAGLVIFAVTYALVAARRLDWLKLDRPAGALLGAVACVVAGVLTPERAVAAIDPSTLLLLFGVMGMGAFLDVDGFFARVETALVALAPTRGRLLGLVVWGSGALAALITNDAVCVLAAPLLVRVVQRYELPALPFLLALATGANTGSVATLVGNPQNMLCGLLGDLSYRDYLLLMAPVAILGLALNHAVLALVFRRDLGAALVAASAPTAAPATRRSYVTLGVILGTAVAYTLGANLAWAAAAGFTLLMLIHRHDTRLLWPRIDFALLIFFAGLFVVVEGLMASGAPALFFERFPLASSLDAPAEWARLSAIFLVGSNVVSNVPFILVVREPMAALPDPTFGWQLLAMASTFAGNLTLLGSVANIIVAEAGREVGGIGFFQHLKVGLPIGLLTTAAGLGWLLLVR